MVKIKTSIFIIGWLMSLMMYSCVDNSNNRINAKEVRFSCKEMYIDTTGFDVKILFKIHASNQSSSNFYFFSNPSIYHRDSVYSNFYLWDTVQHLKYQLLLEPSSNPLFSKKKFNLPVLLIQQVMWKDLKQINNKWNTDLKMSKKSLAKKFLKQCRLIQVSDKRDFIIHHISLSGLINDTIPITFTDSVLVYFTVPDIKGFLNDSLFSKQHPNKIFFLK